MSEKKIVPFSIIDFAPISQGSLARDAFRTTLALARLAEKVGYHRYWLAEHHNMTGIASTATAILISYLATHTQNLRIGSGGIMLPNHCPLVIAEQFGTLESLYPGRIDLGLGRAPGCDPNTMRLLRNNRSGQPESYPDDVQQLITWFDAPPGEQPAIQPVPGLGLRIPIWLMGSSLYSANLAAKLGLPFAFASHFAPEMTFKALRLYRENFQPSARLAAPYAMVCVNVITADSDREARYLFTSMQQQFINLRYGKTGPLPAPVDNLDSIATPAEQYGIQEALNMSITGNANTVRHALTSLLRETQADEILVNGQIHDPVARLDSFERTMEVVKSL